MNTPEQTTDKLLKGCMDCKCASYDIDDDRIEIYCPLCLARIKERISSWKEEVETYKEDIKYHFGCSDLSHSQQYKIDCKIDERISILSKQIVRLKKKTQ